MLHDGPVEVETAANGVEGLKRARTQTFHLILLDVVLPLMDGVTVCRMLKGDPVTASVPLYMLTAKVKKADMEAALAAGANGYIHKPFRAAELMELVDQAPRGPRPGRRSRLSPSSGTVLGKPGVEKPGQGEEVVPVQPFEFHGHTLGVDAGDASTEGAHHVSRQRDGEVEHLSGLARRSPPEAVPPWRGLGPAPPKPRLGRGPPLQSRRGRAGASSAGLPGCEGTGRAWPGVSTGSVGPS